MTAPNADQAYARPTTNELVLQGEEGSDRVRHLLLKMPCKMVELHLASSVLPSIF